MAYNLWDVYRNRLMDRYPDLSHVELDCLINYIQQKLLQRHLILNPTSKPIIPWDSVAQVAEGYFEEKSPLNSYFNSPSITHLWRRSSLIFYSIRWLLLVVFAFLIVLVSLYFAKPFNFDVYRFVDFCKGICT